MVEVINEIKVEIKLKRMIVFATVMRENMGKGIVKENCKLSVYFSK